MDDDDVSVADLLIREGWDDHEESRAKSRWRVIAVVIAVVVACGAAAVLVGFDSEPEPNAAPNQMSVIEMPKRPSDNGGAGGTSAVPSTETVETGEGEPSSRPSRTTSSRRTSSSAVQTSDSPDPTTAPTSSNAPADPPRTTGSTVIPQPPNPTPPPSTTPTEECKLWPKWLFC
ncbi:serine/threonine protein kinase [Amycolatopsis roodepoortensis]|uniref:serine/threonine protein kinase n=1 Tax=Amycolatopsis roodepoortensis TaxID=700274 RepID=UPI00214BE925|nr:serine/threonine protein kinase [Amycolatopsis roodepoortensis]UUV35774.1 serine/threonine protein kinase [Amycolatopsis roodepoortensis]